jgi:thiol-disulfide isomerase/thioredoxin
MLDTRARKTETLEVGRPAPNFSVADLANATVRLSDYRGKKAVFIDFWATWCGPCRMSMPDLQRIADDFKGHDLEILSVDEGETATQVADFASRERYSFHYVLDPNSEVGVLYGVRGIPTQVLVDKQGVVRWLRVGFSPRDAELRRLLRVLDREEPR